MVLQDSELFVRVLACVLQPFLDPLENLVNGFSLVGEGLILGSLALMDTVDGPIVDVVVNLTVLHRISVF